MDINSKKKDVILGSIGALIVIASLVFIGWSVKRSLKEKKPDTSSSEVESPKEEVDFSQATSSESVSTSSSDQASSPPQKPQSTSTPEPSSEDLKEGSAVMKVPSEPAKEPDQEDIDSIVIKNSQCSPSQVEKRGRSGIILEITAQDQAYRFQVEGTRIEEDLQPNQTKTVSFPGYFVEGDVISFQCEPLN